jgi:Transposase domain (DUF772)
MRPTGPTGAAVLAYEPSMMVALLLYAHARGMRSSRGIERACIQGVAFRVVAGNVAPDHSTIAEFRCRHERPLADVFCGVLGLCARAGRSAHTSRLSMRLDAPTSVAASADAPLVSPDRPHVCADLPAALFLVPRCERAPGLPSLPLVVRQRMPQRYPSRTASPAAA